MVYRKVRKGTEAQRVQILSAVAPLRALPETELIKESLKLRK